MSKVLTIYRDEWIRDDARSFLLREIDGKMCCLGFDALACGVTRDAIAGVREPLQLSPRDVHSEYWKTRCDPDLSSLRHDGLIRRIMRINDNRYIDDATREASLIPLLKQLGWDDVVFLDSRPANG